MKLEPIDGEPWTPIQQSIMDLLEEGMPRTHKQVRGCMYDPINVKPVSIRAKICIIRKRLPPIYDILSTWKRTSVGIRPAYQLVQLLPTARRDKRHKLTSK